MVESYFGLSAKPFSEVPQPEIYFPAGSHDQARESTIRCLTRGAGPAVLLGAPGTGKTMVCERIAFELQSRFPIVNLRWGYSGDRRGLLQGILYKLDLPYRNLHESELRLSLIDHLTRSPNCPHGIVLIVDEAQVLSTDLLDEIRTLTNVVADGEPRVRVILSGQPSLDETLALVEMQSLQQRIASRATLKVFRQEETVAFVRQAIARCSGQPQRIFDEETLATVHDLTNGNPRLVGQLCDHALIMAYIDDQTAVSAELLHEAWADLQQLPIPLESFRSRANHTHDATTIEFGGLDGEDLNLIPFRSPTSTAPTFDSLRQLPERDTVESEDQIASGIDSNPIGPLASDTWEPSHAIDVSGNNACDGGAGQSCGTQTCGSADLFGHGFSEDEEVEDQYTRQATLQPPIWVGSSLTNRAPDPIAPDPIAIDPIPIGPIAAVASRTNIELGSPTIEPASVDPRWHEIPAHNEPWTTDGQGDERPMSNWNPEFAEPTGCGEERRTYRSLFLNLEARRSKKTS